MFIRSPGSVNREIEKVSQTEPRNTISDNRQQGPYSSQSHDWGREGGISVSLLVSLPCTMRVNEVGGWASEGELKVIVNLFGC